MFSLQSREFETSRKLHEHVGDLERIIDSLNDEVSEKTSKIGEYEQMVASYQVMVVLCMKGQGKDGSDGNLVEIVKGLL